jgi:hypothetical protein
MGRIEKTQNKPTVSIASGGPRLGEGPQVAGLPDAGSQKQTHRRMLSIREFDETKPNRRGKC